MEYDISDSASVWISNKIVSEIFGICCEVSHDVTLRCKFEETKGFNKLLFLVDNFSQFVDML